MEHLILKDLEKGFVYYPSCGTDFHAMCTVLNEFGMKYNTFIYCDAGRPILETLKQYHNALPLSHIENKLGLAGFEILSVTEYSSFSKTVDITSIITNLISRYGEHYHDYVNTIFDQRVCRYELTSNGHNLVLYFFRFEALAILKWLLQIVRNQNIESGFILHRPGFGWTDSKFENALISAYEEAQYTPQFMITDGYKWNNKYPHWKYVDLGQNRQPFLRTLNNLN
jgi:hypothetical protein